MPLLPAIEFATQAQIRASVIWLHGLGADGHDFVPVVRELQLPEELGIRFIFPHAPHQAVTINQGAVMRAWYDIRWDGLDRQTDRTGVLNSAAALDALITREIERGIPSNSIVLAGFSQGGAIVLTAGTRYPQPLAGIMALSTYLPLPDLLDPAAAIQRPLPIFMAHGSQDQVIPLELARNSRNTLAGAGYPVQWKEYPMAHSLCQEEIEAISSWLQERLGGE